MFAVYKNKEPINLSLLVQMPIKNLMAYDKSHRRVPNIGFRLTHEIWTGNGRAKEAVWWFKHQEDCNKAFNYVNKLIRKDRYII